MGKEQRCYQTIKAILAKHGNPPYKKEQIKSEIIGSIREYDYVSAVIAYLWGAYNHFDPVAKTAFKDVFFDDVKAHDETAFYFFSFYFSHEFKRTGFDRRQIGDRRECYSLDHFSRTAKDQRKGRERRRRIEKRTHWTRVTEWASVPFKADRSLPEEDRSEELLNGGRQRLDQLTDGENRQEDLENLNTLLSNLVTYYENHIQQGQTEWMDHIDEETFHRAKEVMKSLAEANRKKP